ncbi:MULTISPECIES: ATP-binding protein [unclassified Sphingomonas]|jgi:two-component system, NtrC family, nitrogen regulation sensor histidine kinase NtrY|uniref:sensor histidine kinase NtrY-like n=1 Tax=unclassified Sphingomonas TaxID=196159 RepID=UPI000E108A06|nr:MULTISPECIES: ATP-binding protein [unclassified Sphingomonas]AXJ96533.1 PAS domain-containing sensor histidine kinase [Sphingomonas sp. FARSPH]
MTASTTPSHAPPPEHRWLRITPAVEAAAGGAALLIVLVTWRLIAGTKSADTLLSPPVAATLLMANLLWAVLLIALVGRRIALRRTAATGFAGGGRLHVRLVAIFSLMASVPIILAVVAASVMFQSGIQFWGSERARGAFNATIALAKQGQDLVIQRWTGEARKMAQDLHTDFPTVPKDNAALQAMLLQQTYNRNLYQALIFKVVNGSTVEPLYGYAVPSARVFGQRVTGRDLNQLTGQQSFTNYDSQMLWVVTPIDRAQNTFLYVATPNNVEFLNNQTQAATQQLAAYDSLQARARTLQLRFNLALFGVALLIVGLATWIALRVADWLAKPVGELVTAADRVASGDLTSRVAEPRTADEIGVLANAFNRMTERLGEQTNALVEANAAAETRRALIEAVMAGVSAGVVATAPDGVIRIVNHSATELLGEEQGHGLVGRKLADAAPELADFVASGDREAIVQIARPGEPLTLAVRIARTGAGPILTFDDITQQLLDQRRAAWSDVARRIAHEIKNPLTPIQLAAERLQRRYGSKIDAEDTTFARLTDTIVRQVGDLRRMVDEFSSFARMPKPVFREESAVDIGRQALFLHEVAHPGIRFSFDHPASMPTLVCDRRQLSQALLNIVKNAVEAIESKGDGGGAVTMRMREEGDLLSIEVEDTGIGLPPERDRIVEPYVTTRARGTGLGLAIVKKIVEEHHGTMTFADRDGGGTVVRMAFDAAALRRLDQGADAPAPAGEGRLPVFTPSDRT